MDRSKEECLKRVRVTNPQGFMTTTPSSIEALLRSQNSRRLAITLLTRKSLLPLFIAPVRLRSGSRECVEPKYAMLNTCSTGSFVLEDIADSLGIKGADTRLTEKTMYGRQFQDTKIQNGLVFSDLRGKNRVQLPKVFTSEDLSQREDLFSHKVVHK